MKFKDTDLEDEFKKVYQKNNDAFALMFTVLSTLFFTLFYLIYNLSHPIWFIAMGVLSVLYGISILTQLIHKIYYPAIFIYSTIIVVSYLQRMLLYSNTDNVGLAEYVMGLLLIIFVSGIFLRTLFRYSIFFNALIFLIYFYNSTVLLKLNEHLPGFYVYSTILVFTLLAVNTILVFNFEHINRDSFVKQKKVELQALELQETNQIIEQKVIERTRELEQEKIKKQKAIIVGQQIERKRIAKDLHDSMTIDLIVLKRKLEASECSKDVIEGLDKSIEKMRNISRNLLPYSLIHYGLFMATEELCSKAKGNSHMNISMSKTGINDETRWDSTVEIEIFYVLQELVSNTIKYANAKNLFIEFIADDETINISVEDDGVGFDFSDETIDRFGLNNVDARISLLGGTVNIDSQVGKGTIIMINLPIYTEND